MSYATGNRAQAVQTAEHGPTQRRDLSREKQSRVQRNSVRPVRSCVRLPARPGSRHRRRSLGRLVARQSAMQHRIRFHSHARLEIRGSLFSRVPRFLSGSPASETCRSCDSSDRCLAHWIKRIFRCFGEARRNLFISQMNLFLPCSPKLANLNNTVCTKPISEFPTGIPPKNERAI